MFYTCYCNDKTMSIHSFEIYSQFSCNEICFPLEFLISIHVHFQYSSHTFTASTCFYSYSSTTNIQCLNSPPSLLYHINVQLWFQPIFLHSFIFYSIQYSIVRCYRKLTSRLETYQTTKQPVHEFISTWWPVWSKCTHFMEFYCQRHNVTTLCFVGSIQ